MVTSNKSTDGEAILNEAGFISDKIERRKDSISKDQKVRNDRLLGKYTVKDSISKDQKR